MSGGGFFLAYFLGAHDLGLFQLSDRIDTYVLGSLLGPLIPVLSTSFARSPRNPAPAGACSSAASWLLTPISLAVAGVIVVAARPLEALFGPKWHGVADVMALNAIADGISYTILPAPSLLRAHGLAKVVAAMRLVTVAAQIVVYMRLAPHGLVPFVYGKLILELAIYAGSLLVLARSLQATRHAYDRHARSDNSSSSPSARLLGVVATTGASRSGSAHCIECGPCGLRDPSRRVSLPDPAGAADIHARAPVRRQVTPRAGLSRLPGEGISRPSATACRCACP